jgi:DNA-binding response OmpR family regulator
MRTAQILVADDDASVRFLRRRLSREGHQVAVADTVEAALAVCAENPPDLVLVDLVAPRGQGFDLCRRLTNRPSTRSFVNAVTLGPA